MSFIYPRVSQIVLKTGGDGQKKWQVIRPAGKYSPHIWPRGGTQLDFQPWFSLFNLLSLARFFLKDVELGLSDFLSRQASPQLTTPKNKETKKQQKNNTTHFFLSFFLLPEFLFSNPSLRRIPPPHSPAYRRRACGSPTALSLTLFIKISSLISSSTFLFSFFPPLETGFCGILSCP